MDDFNKDKVVSKEDAVALASVLEGLAKTAELGVVHRRHRHLRFDRRLTGPSCTSTRARGGPGGKLEIRL